VGVKPYFLATRAEGKSSKVHIPSSAAAGRGGARSGSASRMARRGRIIVGVSGRFGSAFA
jgi:hypothetical protein